MTPIKYEVAEVALVYRSKLRAADRPIISHSEDAMACLRSAYDLDTIGIQEQFIAIYLNRGNRVLGIYRASVGGITGTVCDPKLILSVAIKLAACGIILSHNHPSGHLHPSNADQELTLKMRDGAKLLDIRVLDHLIVDPELERFYSFADEGVL